MLKKIIALFILVMCTYTHINGQSLIDSSEAVQLIDSASAEIESGIQTIIDQGKEIADNPINTKADFKILWYFLFGLIASVGVYLTRLFPALDNVFRKNIILAISFALAVVIGVTALRGEYGIGQILLDWGLVLVTEVGLYELVLKWIAGRTRKPEPVSEEGNNTSTRNA